MPRHMSAVSATRQHQSNEGKENAKTDVTPATKSRDFDARRGVARQSRKCDRACRTLRHGASHCRATRSPNRVLLYSMRQNRRCDIGLTISLGINTTVYYVLRTCFNNKTIAQKCPCKQSKHQKTTSRPTNADCSLFPCSDY